MRNRGRVEPEFDVESLLSHVDGAPQDLRTDDVEVVSDAGPLSLKDKLTQKASAIGRKASGVATAAASVAAQKLQEVANAKPQQARASTGPSKDLDHIAATFAPMQTAKPKGGDERLQSTPAPKTSRLKFVACLVGAFALGAWGLRPATPTTKQQAVQTAAPAPTEKHEPTEAERSIERDGRVWVSGYRRQDGTWVDGYWRDAPQDVAQKPALGPSDIPLTLPVTLQVGLNSPGVSEPSVQKTAPANGSSDDSDSAWVDGYYRADGSFVAGHWRGAPDGDKSNNKPAHSTSSRSSSSKSKSSSGDVAVGGYMRGGKWVQGHTRSKPDGDKSNNKSSRSNSKK